MAGLFATFEGIDGSGKTTALARVADALESSGHAVVRTTEPTSTWRGDAVRWAIDGSVDAVTESFLFLADRAAHGGRIRRWTSEGKVVLSDRYADSTYAYQGARLEGRRARPVAWLREISAPHVVDPDVTFFLAVPPEVAMSRLGTRDRTTRFEDLEFLRRVDANYRVLAADPRFVTLDGTEAPDAVASGVLAVLRPRL